MKKPKKTKSQPKKTRKSYIKKKRPPRKAAVPKRPKRERAVAPAPREVGLLDAIGEVMADAEELGQEMRDWADNMPESKQSSQKYDEVSECADTLENVAGNDPVTSETMSFLNDIKITIQDLTPRRRGYSRASRLAQALGVLSDVINALEEFKPDDKDAKERLRKEETAGGLRDALEEEQGNLEGVEFPGMFG